jgi:non-ribosomal peptide synthetase component F
VADGSPKDLASAEGGGASLQVVLAGRFDPAPLLAAGAVAHGPDGECRRFTAADTVAAAIALGQVLQRGGTLVDVQMTRPRLERAYLRLMGETPPDEGEAVP